MSIKITNKDTYSTIYRYKKNGYKFPLNFRPNTAPMNPFVVVYFSLLFISPFLAYYIQILFNIQPIYLLGSVSVLPAIIIATKKGFRIPNYIYPLILFCIYYSIWDFYNGRYEQFGIMKLLFKNYSLHSIAILLVIENVNFNDKFIKVAIKIFKLLAILSFIVSIYQFLFNPHFFIPDELIKHGSSDNDYVRNSSIWGYLGLNSVGLSFLPIMALIINYVLLENKVIRAFLWIGIAGTVAVLTNDRYAMVNFLILLFLPIILIRGTKIKKIFLSIVSCLIIIFLLFGIFSISGINVGKYYKDRILSKSGDSRIIAFKMFSEFFPQKPIFGSGVHVEPKLKTALAHRSSQIHVGYLSSLYEYGIIGSSFLFTFWFLVARRFYKTSKISKQYAIFIGFLCFLLANLTLVVYSIFQVGIIFLFVFNRYYNIKNILEKSY